jgi:hypothetical protein
MRGRSETWHRATEPFMFWFTLSAYVITAVLLAIAAILALARMGLLISN